MAKVVILIEDIIEDGEDSIKVEFTCDTPLEDDVPPTMSQEVAAHLHEYLCRQQELAEEQLKPKIITEDTPELII